MYDLARESSYPSPVANSTLLPLLLMSLLQQKNAPDHMKTLDMLLPEYDVIIVGAGSAGSAIAGRLAEVSCINILLLEAGDVPPYIIDVPSFQRYFQRTDIDWNHTTTSQLHTGRLMKNRSVPIATGKGLGGSSILNAMMYVRGNKNDYNRWKAAGADGWSYEDVLPYFKKLEDNKDPYYLANGYHAAGGPVTVETPVFHSVIKEHVMQEAKKLGYDFVDSNGPKQTGFYDNQANIRNAQRCHTSKAYLVPAENRTNLHIVTKALVHKINIEQNIAVGVSFEVNGQMYEVKVTQEVIVSAGGINTPKLLLLSGIGPEKELQKHGIPVIKDLPVGENFHDHCFTFSNFEVQKSIRTSQERLSDPNNIMEYINNRTGILASPNVQYLMAFVNDDNSTVADDDPDFQILIIENLPGRLGAPGLLDSAYQQIYSPYDNVPSYLCASQTLRPKSRGTVRLRSSNPRDPPLADPNYLADPEDLKHSISGLKLCHKIAATTAMQKIGTKPFSTPYPGCQHLMTEGTLDDFLECQVKSEVITGFHPVGTSKMGSIGDPTTVVDPLLRVKGIKGLRVADASIMPEVISGNTNIPSIMIGEKAADLIKQSIKCKQVK